MQRLMEIPGVGPTIATALVAAVGTGASFGKGRDLAAWLGLVPRQITTGGKRAIAGGRRARRHVLFQAALVAAHHNPILKAFAQRLRDAGKPHKVIMTAVARKFVNIANALCKARKPWDPQAA